MIVDIFKTPIYTIKKNLDVNYYTKKALEFEKKEKIYNLIAEIYAVLGNKELSEKLSDKDLRLKTVNSLKNEMSGIYRKNQNE